VPSRELVGASQPVRSEELAGSEMSSREESQQRRPRRPVAPVPSSSPAGLSEASISQHQATSGQDGAQVPQAVRPPSRMDETPSSAMRRHSRNPSSTNRTIPRVLLTSRLAAGDKSELANGNWLHLGNGLYTEPLPADPRRPWLRERHFFLSELRVLAQRTTGDPIVIAGEAAACIWGADLLKMPEHIDYYQSGGATARAVLNYAHRLHPRRHKSLGIPGAHVCEVDGVYVTDRLRTAFDVGRWSNTERAVVAISSLMRQLIDSDDWWDRRSAGLLRKDEARIKEQIIGTLDGAGTKAGLARARRRVVCSSALCDSAGESRLWWILQLFGFPLPEQQLPIVTEEGLRFADFAWPQWKRIVEFDGMEKLQQAGGKEGLEQLFAREDALRRAGWQVMHVRWRDLSDPHSLARRLHRFLSPEASVRIRVRNELL